MHDTIPPKMIIQGVTLAQCIYIGIYMVYGIHVCMHIHKQLIVGGMNTPVQLLQITTMIYLTLA